MEQEFVVLGVRKYSFRNDAGSQVQGVNVSYLYPANGNPSFKGFIPLSISGSYLLFEKFISVPGVYKFIFDYIPGKGGSLLVRLRDVEFVRPVEIKEVF